MVFVPFNNNDCLLAYSKTSETVWVRPPCRTAGKLRFPKSSQAFSDLPLFSAPLQHLPLNAFLFSAAHSARPSVQRHLAGSDDLDGHPQFFQASMRAATGGGRGDEGDR